MSRSHTDPVRLTDRECEVLRLVARGLSAKETALDLAIAPCTVQRHMDNVRLKTRTRNRAHMIAHVIRAGMLPAIGENERVELAQAG